MKKKEVASTESVKEGLLNNSLRECDVDLEVPADVPESVQTIGQLAIYLNEIGK